MQKSQQQMEQEIVAYLNKASKHLFIDKNGYLTKIILFRKNDKWHYATVKFNTTDIKISIREALSDYTYKYYGNNSLQLIKSSLFPKDHGMKSIPNFKASKAIINKVKEVLETYDGTKASEDKINTSAKDCIQGLEVQTT